MQLRSPTVAKLVTALRSNFDLPVDVHTHDTRAVSWRPIRPGS